MQKIDRLSVFTINSLFLSSSKLIFSKDEIFPLFEMDKLKFITWLSQRGVFWREFWRVGEPTASIKNPIKAFAQPCHKSNLLEEECFCFGCDIPTLSQYSWIQHMQGQNILRKYVNPSYYVSREPCDNTNSDSRRQSVDYVWGLAIASVTNPRGFFPLIPINFPGDDDQKEYV